MRTWVVRVSLHVEVLIWYAELLIERVVAAYHSISNFPGPQLVTDGVKRWVQTTTLI
jgi:hypothetical protein